jgi:ubiquinone biosynthesis protein COQ4
MNLWNKIRIMLLFFKLVKDPTQTDLIFKGIKTATHDKNNVAIENVEKAILANDEFREMFEAHYIPRNPTLLELEVMPLGSFGRSLHQHLQSNGLSLKFYPQLETKLALEYISQRLYQDHDLWHTLLGYGITIEDELAVQAFGVAQYGSPVAVFIITGGLLHLMGKNPERAVQAMRQIVEAYMVGRRAEFLLGARLHEMLALPIAEVRRTCGIVLKSESRATIRSRTHHQTSM